MAKMIPSDGPRDRDGNLEKSLEGKMYYALSSLPDDYWVLHSYKVVYLKDEQIEEREADFIVFHPELGILCIEAKAGRVRFSRDRWRYANGKPMKRNGPYGQASDMMHKIMDKFGECGCRDLLNNCRTGFAVWFPSINASLLDNIGIASDAERVITLSLDDLADPEPAIRRIFDVTAPWKKTKLTRDQAREIIEKVLCPTLDLAPTARFEYDIANVAFVRLLESQAKILDFIEDQTSAAIQGAAGTGKTLIAVEYAKRASSKGEKTLYLCRTSMLAKDIQSRLKDFEGADAFTIDAFATKMGVPSGSISEKCAGLSAELMNLWEYGRFPYQHVVIDEGQDFGESCIRDNEIIDLLYDIVKEKKGGTLYMFYDACQETSGGGIPSFVDEADCRLTLKVNCRNSRYIADCAIRGADMAFEQDGRYRAQGIPVGGKPQLYISSDRKDQRRYIDERIGELRSKGLDDIVIVTCKTVEKSSLKGYTSQGRGWATWGKTRIPFTTFTKFKGMEADAVILVDFDTDAWSMEMIDYWEPGQGDWSEEDYDRWYRKQLKENKVPASSKPFYTAASRAKFELSIVGSMDTWECEDLVHMIGENPGRKPMRKLAKLLHAQLVSQ